MTARVIAWPHAYLATPALRVLRVSDDIRDLAAVLLETVKAAGGASLSAQQTGAPYRVLVVRGGLDEGQDADLAMINPEIVSASGRVSRVAEGCLSFPGASVSVERVETVTVRWTGLDGAGQEQAFAGITGRAVQHELEHLDGVTLYDHAGPAKRLSLKRRFPKVEGGRSYDWTPREGA